MKKTFLKITFIFFFALTFLNCQTEPSSDTAGAQTQSSVNESHGEESNPASQSENPSESSTSSSNTIWTGSQDFNDSSWSINIQISADKFQNISGGDKIQIYWTASNTATSYKKLQLDSMGSSWTELTGGSYSGGYKESGENSAGMVPTSSPLSYSLTSSNAAALKSYGLAIMGYGLVITKISIISGNGSSSENNQDNQTEENEEESQIIPKAKPTSVTGTPFANHGKLHVSGAYLYDKNNKKYQLYGMSTHGLNFGDDFSRYVNEAAFQELVDEWNTNCIRLVLYPKDYNGYCNGGDHSKLKTIIKNGIDYATKEGMYVILDWHVHNYNPNDTKDAAITFLSQIAQEYAAYDNILYEICNEPTGSPWSSAIKPYAQEVIPAIRKYAPDAVIIVGTNTWSQDVEEALASPLPPESYGNIMYTFHFYANSHTTSYRSRVESAIKGGLPIFITEFGTCDASGNGGFNKGESEKWFELCKKYSISHMNWSLSNKNETASAILSSCSKTSGWSDSDLSESGKLVKSHFIKDCER